MNNLYVIGQSKLISMGEYDPPVEIPEGSPIVCDEIYYEKLEIWNEVEDEHGEVGLSLNRGIELSTLFVQDISGRIYRPEEGYCLSDNIRRETLKDLFDQWDSMESNFRQTNYTFPSENSNQLFYTFISLTKNGITKNDLQKIIDNPYIENIFTITKFFGDKGATSRLITGVMGKIDEEDVLNIGNISGDYAEDINILLKYYSKLDSRNRSGRIVFSLNGMTSEEVNMDNDKLFHIEKTLNSDAFTGDYVYSIAIRSNTDFHSRPQNLEIIGLINIDTIRKDPDNGIVDLREYLTAKRFFEDEGYIKDGMYMIVLPDRSTQVIQINSNHTHGKNYTVNEVESFNDYQKRKETEEEERKRRSKGNKPPKDTPYYFG